MFIFDSITNLLPNRFQLVRFESLEVRGATFYGNFDAQFFCIRMHCPRDITESVRGVNFVDGSVGKNDQLLLAANERRGCNVADDFDLLLCGIVRDRHAANVERCHALR